MLDNCKECGQELHGLKKMFCSRKCKDRYKNRNRTLEQKEKYRQQQKITYSNNKEARLKNKKEYYQKNKEEIKEKNSRYKKEHPETDQKYNKGVKGRYRDYKKGAITRGYEFALTIEDFQEMWNTKCYYCDEIIDGIGIDRVNNYIGYTKENIVPCCPSCNIMKLTLRQNDFIDKCIKISKKHNKK